MEEYSSYQSTYLIRKIFRKYHNSLFLIPGTQSYLRSRRLIYLALFEWYENMKKLNLHSIHS
jgi:hypothetical protein